MRTVTQQTPLAPAGHGQNLRVELEPVQIRLCYQRQSVRHHLYSTHVRHFVACCSIVLLVFLAACSMPHLESARQESGGPEQTPTSDPGAPPGSNPNGPPQGELPVLTISDVSAAEGDAALRFTVTLSWSSGEAVTVAYETKDDTATGLDYQPARGTLSFATDPPEAQVIEVAVSDDAVAEATETFTVELSDPQGATLATATATGTIIDDERRAVQVEPATLNVPEGGSGRYEVVLGSQPTGPVSVRVARTAELSVEPEELVFSPADWARAAAGEGDGGAGRRRGGRRDGGTDARGERRRVRRGGGVAAGDDR